VHPDDASDRVVIRDRHVEDLDVCVRLAQVVHQVDGYPPYVPNNDFRALLTRPTALAAFVAVATDGIVGHVALHAARAGNAVNFASDCLEVPSRQFGVVARLFTSTEHRRIGVASRLLDAAAEVARARELVPILDVWVELAGAVALYKACGWRNLGTVDVDLPDGRVLPEHVFRAPA
jgi:GNAT superfamily N-acetyltransferase